MALIHCSECNREISDKAAACPHCGCPVSVTNESLIHVNSVPVKRKIEQDTTIIYQAHEQTDNRKKKSRKVNTKRKHIFLIVTILLVMFLVLVFTHIICLSHDYSDATVLDPQTCDYCGKTQGEPKPLMEIEFPSAGIGALLPVPDSNMGEINWNHYDSFNVYVGNTTFEDYENYIKKCMDIGFDINYHQYEDSFSAYDGNRNDLNIYYRGNDIMEVYIHTTGESNENTTKATVFETIAPYLEIIGTEIGDGEKLSLPEEIYYNMSNIELIGVTGEVLYSGVEGKIVSCEWISADTISEDEYINLAEQIIKDIHDEVEIVHKIYDTDDTYCYYWDAYGYSISIVHGVDGYDPDGVLKLEWERVGHGWIPATCTEPQTCYICKKTDGEPIEHDWIDATCTESMMCSICGNTNGNALGHTEGEWILTKDATLTDFGVEELLCSVCGETVDSRDTEKKNPKVDGKSFNFTDEELIDWINDISSAYVGYTDLELFNSDNTSYRVTFSDNEIGALILNHGDNGKDGNICAIMVYFEDNYTSGGMAMWLGEKIDSDFSADAAINKIMYRESYTAADMTVASIELDTNFEVYILAPSEFLADILS